MFELMIKDHISSAHLLRGYPGKCQNLHGHTWTIEVFVCSDTLNELGMVIDFSYLKRELKSFLEHMDHICLNDMEHFQSVNPTAENMASYILTEFQKRLEDVSISKVRVWESPHAYAEFRS